MMKTTALPNGLRVATCTLPHVETVSMGVWVDVGSRYEGADQAGISHFLEHMAFKGTKTRTAYDLVAQVEAVGGDLNAATSQESTCYYLTLLKKDWKLGVDILGDILQNSIFPDHELAREKDVVLQEIDQTEDSPDEVLFELAQKVAFPGQALGRPILGTKETVSAMTKARLESFVAQYYVAGNMVISAAGNIDAEAFTEYVGTVFGGLNRGTASESVRAQYKGGQAAIQKSLEQTHIYHGFAGVPVTHPDFYALQLYANLLGGGMSSRLFQEIREKRGLVYGISAFNSGYRDIGLFNIYTSTSIERPESIIKMINAEMQKAESGISEDELIASKNQLKASLMVSYENTLHWIGGMARQILHLGRVLSPEDLLHTIDSLSLEHVQRASKALRQEGLATTVYVGPAS